jgi:type VI secretion system secreted protein VgrG
MSIARTMMPSASSSQPVLPVVHLQLQCGDHPWRVRRFELLEQAGAPYRGTLEVLCEDAEVEPGELLGADVCLSIGRGDAERVIKGIVLRVEHQRVERELARLVLHVGPAVGLLGRGRASRIFQGKTVLELLDELAGPVLEARHRGIDLSQVTRSFEPRDYCVQYRESDLDFFHRLLDEEGLSYYFDHERDEHETLVVVDGREGAPEVVAWGGGSQVPAIGDRREEAASESIGAISRAQAPTGPRVIQRSWDWAANPPQVFEDAAPAREGSAGELVEHDGRRLWSVDAEGIAAREQEALAAAEVVLEGAGNVTGFAAGMLFELTDSEHEGRYFLTQVEHRGDAPEVELGDGGSGGHAPSYENRFSCIPDEAPFRRLPRSRKPMIHGPQTAVVVGPEGEEIFTDEHGRIKVRFHWDRSSTPDEEASCWVRVAQSWAGPGWGAVLIPRVGMEVVISFLDGDPDRPLCTGCVFNGQNGAPYVLPEERTKTALRTRSSPGGDGFNELCFEDAAGAEQVLLRAQRDHVETVGHDRSRSVGNDEAVSVGGSRTVAVAGNQRTKIGGKAADGAGLPGPHFGIEVDGEYRVEAEETACIEAKRAIRLRCGETVVELTPERITLEAGSGARVVLDASALVESKPGALVCLDDDGRLVAQSKGSAALMLDDAARLRSKAGSTVALTGQAEIRAAAPVADAEGASLRLDADAMLLGDEVTVASSGAELRMTTGAALSGAEIELSGDGVSCSAVQDLKLGAAKIEAAGRTLTTITAPLVKIN